MHLHMSYNPHVQSEHLVTVTVCNTKRPKLFDFHLQKSKFFISQVAISLFEDIWYYVMLH